MPASEIDPSQVAEDNPLVAGLARLTGKKTPLSKSAGTSTGVIGYDPEQTFRPTGDTINLSAAPGTGATTAESWSHDIALSNLKQQQLEFEYQQQQAQLAAAQKAQEFALTQQQFGLTKAEAARQAALGPEQLKAAQLGNQATAQQMALAKQDAALKADQARLDMLGKYGVSSLQDAQAIRATNADQQRYLGGQSVTPQSTAAFLQARSQPNYQTQQPVYSPISAIQAINPNYMSGYYASPKNYGGNNMGYAR